MALPAPRLDDRSFQDLVDDAKRLVQRRCPEWTDHNVSDPGVTLIETFAWMTDLLLYRLNRVPDRHFVKFLELIGVQLFPPTAANVEVTFWLSAPADQRLTIHEQTEVATLRTPDEEPVEFATTADLHITPTSVANVASAPASDGVVRLHDEALAGRQPFFCFAEPPAVGDVFLIGLDVAAPRHVVTLRFDCDIEGIGVDPSSPPLVWEAWTGSDWERCDLERDTTGGLNRPGDVVIHIPGGHEVTVIEGNPAGWLRGRVVESQYGQPEYSASPRILALEAFTIGGDADAVHATTIDEETIGVSEGVPGQRFRLQRAPVVPGQDVVVEVSGDDGWSDWQAVTDFADSDPDDRHFLLDATAGEIVFGPAVRLPDGSMRNYGGVPAKGATIRVDRYRTGGGRHANVAAGAISVLRTPIPTVSRVVNRRSAVGGIDGEDLENAKTRGPIMLRTRNRAVTIEDYEQLARTAAPEIVRVRGVAAEDDAGSGVRILVVPAVADDATGRLRFEQLIPEEDSLRRIAEHLEQRRTIGARVVVEPPRYQGVTVVARVRARRRFAPDALRDDCLRALYDYFHPTRGGPDGDGWPFGRPIHVGEVYSVLQRLPGTDIIEDARLFAADPVTGERGDDVQRLVLDDHALAFSYEHQVMVVD
ncbi:MAG: putative baseplate assembly protein [Ilumatobacter sp.]|uniref:putative baseplate assembly protein n=1 Tax=Ilumatobacter sp. TaxID=1967498 RepID=UPI00261B8078|nr:putative baseplate assembly protein [Ilumatobacter sp.]MDJ0770651.1 putative baseplate assembly protein [Ilumatobacter sp.]